MDIGLPQKEIICEPLELPEPLRTADVPTEVPERVEEPAKAPVK